MVHCKIEHLPNTLWLKTMNLEIHHLYNDFFQTLDVRNTNLKSRFSLSIPKIGHNLTFPLLQISILNSI